MSHRDGGAYPGGFLSLSEAQKVETWQSCSWKKSKFVGGKPQTLLDGRLLDAAWAAPGAPRGAGAPCRELSHRPSALQAPPALPPLLPHLSFPRGHGTWGHKAEVPAGVGGRRACKTSETSVSPPLRECRVPGALVMSSTGSLGGGFQVSSLKLCRRLKTDDQGKFFPGEATSVAGRPMWGQTTQMWVLGTEGPVAVQTQPEEPGGSVGEGI